MEGPEGREAEEMSEVRERVVGYTEAGASARSNGGSMRHGRRLKAPASPWAERVMALFQAMPWTKGELAIKLGFKCWHPVARIMKGGRPAVGFLVRLAALEGAYESEIAAWRAGLRVRRGSRGRIWMLDWRDGKNESREQRGIEAPLGVLGAAADGGPGGRGPASKTVVAPDRIWWRRRPRNPAQQLGRPAAGGGGFSGGA